MNRMLRGMSIVVFGLAIILAGCKKQESTLEQPAPEPVAEPDTSFSEPEPLTVDTSDDVSFREAELAAELERLVNEKLTPVYFEFNSFLLTEESTTHLGDVASFLMEYPTMRVLIEGHCDERGSSEYNIGLGENRARAVKNYLLNYGVSGLQLEITSWGKERPVEYGCFNEECHQKNRRCEFKVLEK